MDNRQDLSSKIMNKNKIKIASQWLVNQLYPVAKSADCRFCSLRFQSYTNKLDT